MRGALPRPCRGRSHFLPLRPSGSGVASCGRLGGTGDGKFQSGRGESAFLPPPPPRRRLRSTRLPRRGLASRPLSPAAATRTPRRRDRRGAGGVFSSFPPARTAIQPDRPPQPASHRRRSGPARRANRPPPPPPQPLRDSAAELAAAPSSRSLPETSYWMQKESGSLM